MSNNNKVIKEIIAEREKQDAKWGEQNHSPIEWVSILTEEVDEVTKAALESYSKHKNKDHSYTEYRKELKVAAVAITKKPLNHKKWSIFFWD